jgi:carbonic anhydrase
MPTPADLLKQSPLGRETDPARPEFLERLCGIQAPDYLWIGCADSRVQANEIVRLAPGELFVHRNIDNVVVPDDLNCVAMVQFAVDVLSVRTQTFEAPSSAGEVRFRPTMFGSRRWPCNMRYC